jgi:hypothetical protein
MPWKVINALFCTGKNENRYNIASSVFAKKTRKVSIVIKLRNSAKFIVMTMMKPKIRDAYSQLI